MYEEMIDSSLMYIEDHMGDDITLAGIAERFNLSAYHFSRIFGFLVGEPYQKYIKKRRVSHALKLLDRGERIIDVSFMTGFSHPESFTRAFKDTFGMSPKQYQLNEQQLQPYGIGKVITRDMVNFRGDLLIKSEYVYYPAKTFVGAMVTQDISELGWLQKLDRLNDGFLGKMADQLGMNQRFQYHMSRCMGEPLYEFKFCMAVENETLVGELPSGVTSFLQEDGWYAKFHYKGSMLELYDCFEKDIIKWIAKKDEHLTFVGQGLMVIYDDCNPGEIDILVRLEREMVSQYG